MSGRTLVAEAKRWARKRLTSSGEPEADPKGRLVAPTQPGRVRKQHRATVVVRGVDHVDGVARITRAARAVRRLLENLVRDRVVEEDLRRELECLLTGRERTDLEVDVYRTALVPAGVDG